MRSVRILLASVALIAAGLTGWALGARGDSTQSTAGPAASAVTEAPPAAPSDPAPQRDVAPGDTPAGDAPGTTQPAPKPKPKPRIFGFGSEPVFPQSGGFWQLPAGPGDAILVTDAEHATRVEFLLTPTGTGVGDLAVRIGQDTNGRDGYMVRWHYKDQPLLAHLTVRATGPGGTTEKVVGVYHPDPVAAS